MLKKDFQLPSLSKTTPGSSRAASDRLHHPDLRRLHVVLLCPSPAGRTTRSCTRFRKAANERRSSRGFDSDSQVAARSKATETTHATRITVVHARLSTTMRSAQVVARGADVSTYRDELGKIVSVARPSSLMLVRRRLDNLRIPDKLGQMISLHLSFTLVHYGMLLTLCARALLRDSTFAYFSPAPSALAHSAMTYLASASKQVRDGHLRSPFAIDRRRDRDLRRHATAIDAAAAVAIVARRGAHPVACRVTRCSPCAEEGCVRWVVMVMQGQWLWHDWRRHRHVWSHCEYACRCRAKCEEGV
eukprot:4884623-Pleurochrysis_carterae.AAC.1